MKIDRTKWEPCELCASKVLKEVGIRDWYGYRIFLRCGIGEIDENERFQFCPKCGRPLTEKAWKELERKVFDCAD